TCQDCGNSPCTCEKPPPEPCPDCGERPCQCAQPKRKLKIKLADGKERFIQHMSATSFWSTDGKPMSAAQFIEQMFGALPALFSDEDELRAIWSKPDTRKKLLDGLEEMGYGRQQLREISKVVDAENSDLYDVLCYIAFALPPISRADRVASHQASIYSEYDYKQKEFLAFVLEH